MEDEVEGSEEAGGRHANTKQLVLFVRGDDEIERVEGNEVVVFLVWEQFR